jgi:hypothetical protein
VLVNKEKKHDIQKQCSDDDEDNIKQKGDNKDMK